MHHGIWDYDNPAAPILHDIVKDGKRIKAVTLLTKQGLIFVFDRETGKPVWPIEEKAGAEPTPCPAKNFRRPSLSPPGPRRFRARAMTRTT